MKRILIIDDEPGSLEVMQEVFEEYTCRVYSATTGADGLVKAVELKPDAILLDLRLPDCKGEDLLKELKAKVPKSRIVIGTAYGDQRIKDALMKDGADDFFDKPIDVNVFERKVRELIGNLSEIRLLIIDDEPEFCQTFKDILVNDSETNWVVYYANSGEEGVKLTEELMPDLISLDLCLNLKGDTRPLNSGLAVYRKLKEKGFHIPIVVLASYIDSSEAEQLTQEGLGTIFSKTELMGMTNMTHFLNVLKRIALRGGYYPKNKRS